MRIRQQLIARGYWQEAGDTGSAGGGGALASSAPTVTTLLSGDGASADSQPSSTDGSAAGDGTQATQQPDGSAAQEGQQQAENKDGQQDKPAVPEAYDFKAPEGSELDAKLIESFTPLAKELGLSNEQAQKVVDLVPQLQQRIAEQQAEAWGKQVQDWAEAVKADKEIGGDNFQGSLVAVQKVMQQFGTPELKQMLEQTGMGNNPELVKLIVKVCKAMSEDQFIAGGKSNGGARDVASILYGQQS